MTKKLEEEFNLPPIDEALDAEKSEQEPVNIQTVEDAISVSEKINNALQAVSYTHLTLPTKA